MKLKLLKDRGLLKAGDAFYPRLDEKGQKLIDAGGAELHPEQDEEVKETEVVLYMDEAGNWKTSNVPVDEVERFKAEHDFSADKATANEDFTTSREVIQTPADEEGQSNKAQINKIGSTKKVKK